MPNGHDKNFARLVTVCAGYHRRFGEWPTFVRMEPVILWDLMVLLGERQFVDLAGRSRFNTRKKWGLGAGGPKGFVDYGEEPQDLDHELTVRWLRVRPLPEGHE